jgi:hypothetical protein
MLFAAAIFALLPLRPADPIGLIGYCEPTEYNSGDCAIGGKGSFQWPLLSRFNGTVDRDAKEIEGMRDCVRECLSCASCFYVSFSRNERDCSWYQSCDLDALQNEFDFTHHHPRKVREADGSITAESKTFLDGPRASTLSRPRPRLVDLVVYGGPHYDALLELRMSELSRADLFIVVEHVRPGGAAAGRRFDKTSDRFRPYADRTHHILRETPLLDEFIDLEQMSFEHRQYAMTAWQEAHKQVAQHGDVVLVGDIDEVPRAAVLEALLQSDERLTELDDSMVFVLQGPTYYCTTA